MNDSNTYNDFHNATCALCGLYLTRPYTAIWGGTRPWKYVPGIGHLCPMCQDERESAGSEASA